MVDSEERVPCYLLAPQMCDEYISKGLILRLPRDTGNTPRIQKFSFFSFLKGKFPLSHFLLSLHRPTWG
jgi:hypothetical protein